jgi:hypothetical protein
LRSPFGEGCGRGGNGFVHLSGSRQGNLGLQLSAGGVVDISESSGASGQRLTIDPMMNFAQLVTRGKGMG